MGGLPLSWVYASASLRRVNAGDVNRGESSAVPLGRETIDRKRRDNGSQFGRLEGSAPVKVLQSTDSASTGRVQAVATGGIL